MTSSSNEIFPSSTAISAKYAVNCLETEAILNTVESVIDRLFEISAMPIAFLYSTLPFFTMPIAMPGLFGLQYDSKMESVRSLLFESKLICALLVLNITRIISDIILFICLVYININGKGIIRVRRPLTFCCYLASIGVDW